MRVRTWMVALVLAVAAFGLGATGAPGQAAAAAVAWLTSGGHVELAGPVGDAVRQAL